MLHLLDDPDGLSARLEAHQQALLATRGGGDRGQVARAEAEVRADPARHITIDDRGHATLSADGRTYEAGRFEVAALGTLRERALAARERAGRPPARLSLWVFDGTGPATDIGGLQATAAAGSVFQVASQFNCLESPGPYLTDVARYFQDPTQGPRAAISAFPGTLVRHYAVQTERRQIELLGDVCARGLATVRNGYLLPSDIVDPRAFADVLERGFESLPLGIHEAVEVVLGYDWDGAVPAGSTPRITQVFTSTVAAGLYGRLDPHDEDLRTICRHLQRAAYLGTLLAAIGLGNERVALTLIGGGAFGNPIELIWEAILWACDSVRDLLHRNLVVVVNGRTLGQQLAATRLRDAAQARGGDLVHFGLDGRVTVGAA
jgi:hypothetical protein